MSIVFAVTATRGTACAPRFKKKKLVANFNWDTDSQFMIGSFVSSSNFVKVPNCYEDNT